MTLFFILLHALATATHLQVESSFQFSPVEPNSIAQGIQFHESIGTFFGYSLAARSALTRSTLDRVEYAGNARFLPFPWVVFTIRANQQALLSVGSGTTDFLTTIRLEGFPLTWIGFFVEGGWFERWIALASESLFPALSPTSVRDHDFAARFGFHLRPIERLLLTASAGTIEDLLVFNFNNPFMEFRTSYRFGELTAYAFTRYKMLLGFGRLDELTAGLGAHLIF